MVVAGEFYQVFDVVRLKIYVMGNLRRAGVAGGDVYFIGFGALGQLPDQGVLSGPAPDD